jgi:uncharacterized membrane protein YgcG
LCACALALAAPSYAQAPAGQPRVYSAEELDGLVGPIALYPDDLVSIVLPASSYPLQIVQAARFLEDRARDPNLQPNRDWDESVIALLNYPEVVKLLNEDLDWTWKLGEAFINQQAEVMDAVQRFRGRAYAAGNLKSDEHQLVTNRDGVIEIKRVDATVLYVPRYEPREVVVQRVEPVYQYYPDPYPVYYYPYPVDYVFPGGFFWGVSTFFSLGWHTHHVHMHYYDQPGHPFFGHSYHPHHFRPWGYSRVNINVNVHDHDRRWDDDGHQRDWDDADRPDHDHWDGDGDRYDGSVIWRPRDHRAGDRPSRRRDRDDERDDRNAPRRVWDTREGREPVITRADSSNEVATPSSPRPPRVEQVRAAEDLAVRGRPVGRPKTTTTNRTESSIFENREARPTPRAPAASPPVVQARDEPGVSTTRTYRVSPPSPPATEGLRAAPRAVVAQPSPSRPAIASQSRPEVPSQTRTAAVTPRAYPSAPPAAAYVRSAPTGSEASSSSAGRSGRAPVTSNSAGGSSRSGPVTASASSGQGASYGGGGRSSSSSRREHRD